MTPVVGRTSRRTSRMKSRLRNVAGAYWRSSLIKLTHLENFGHRVADASVDVASVQISALGHARAVLRALAKRKTAQRRPWQGMKSASPYARADRRAPKGECPIYPSHALSAFAAIGRGPKSGEVAQARACHRFPVDSVAFRILSEAVLSGATPCRGEQPRASTPRRRPDHCD